MRQIQTLIASLLAVLLMGVTMNESYAQSQYRRQSNSERKSNSEYLPAKSKPAQQAARPAQNQRPSQTARPSRPSRPSQSVSPGKNARPNHAVRPPHNQKPANMPQPPVNHFRPKHIHKGMATHLRPRPSVHFYGYYTKILPAGAKIIHRGPHDYYYVSGRYYRLINNVYVISRPPVGAVIAKSILNGLLRLTDYAIRDAYGRTQRYYTDDDGVYYVKSGSNYIVVDPPVGAIVYELPYGFEEVTIKGVKYYRVDDNFYELVYNGPRDYYFRVVGTLGR